MIQITLISLLLLWTRYLAPNSTFEKLPIKTINREHGYQQQTLLWYHFCIIDQETSVFIFVANFILPCRHLKQIIWMQQLFQSYKFISHNHLGMSLLVSHLNTNMIYSHSFIFLSYIGVPYWPRRNWDSIRDAKGSYNSRAARAHTPHVHLRLLP